MVTKTAGRPPIHPVAATRSATSNGKPNIPPNRPNVQPMQPRKDPRNEINHPNKLQNASTVVMGMFTNPSAGPRGKSPYISTSDFFESKEVSSNN